MYIIIHDSGDDYCSLHGIYKELNEELINGCLNIGDIQIVNSEDLSFLVDSNEGVLVWQKIPEK